MQIDVTAAAERLAAALRIPTVSYSDAPRDGNAFLQLHRLLQESFPRVHATLTREVVNEYSLLYTWPGRDAGKSPVVFLAHLDVVPVEPGTEQDWTHPPFDGVVAEGYVWGRGALDLKCSVLAILEAAEALLAEGKAPETTVYFAFGHDEEIGGHDGARVIAELLRSRGVRPACVLDEGAFVLDGLMPQIARPVALIGVAEKGYVNVELGVDASGGHASMPARETAVGILARAISALERRPFPARLRHTARAMFQALRPHLPVIQRLMFANLWLFERLIVRVLERSPGMNAELRTTMAPTVVQGSVKENVLAQHARAVVNVRLLPGDTVADALAYIRRVVNDARVSVTPLGLVQEASRMSPASGAAYRWVADAIRTSSPDVIVAPYVTVGTTDARYYASWVDAVYRVVPVRIEMQELGGIHGTNERIGVNAYGVMIRVMRQLMLTAVRLK